MGTPVKDTLRVVKVDTVSYIPYYTDRDTVVRGKRYWPGADLVITVHLSKPAKYRWIQEIYERPMKIWEGNGDTIAVPNPFIDGDRPEKARLSNPPLYYLPGQDEIGDGGRETTFRDRSATYRDNSVWEAQATLVAMVQNQKGRHYTWVASFNWGYKVEKGVVDTLPFHRAYSIWPKTTCILGVEEKSMEACIYP